MDLGSIAVDPGAAWDIPIELGAELGLIEFYFRPIREIKRDGLVTRTNGPTCMKAFEAA